jgi:hypothetical protein
MKLKDLNKNNNRNQLTQRKLRFKQDRVKSYSRETSEDYKENNNNNNYNNNNNNNNNNNVTFCADDENIKLEQKQNYQHNCDLCELKRRNSIDLTDADSYIREKFKEIYLENIYGQSFQRQSTSLFEQNELNKKGKTKI